MATRMSKDVDDLGDSPQEEETNEITTEITELPVCYIATGKMTWDEARAATLSNIDFAKAFLVKQEKLEPYMASFWICAKGADDHGDTCVCGLEQDDYYDHPELKRLEFRQYCDHHDPSPNAGLDGAPTNLVRIRNRHYCEDCGDTCMLDCCTYVKSGIVTNVFS